MGAPGETLRVHTPTSWLYEQPDASSRASSQLLYGEHIRCMETNGDWLRIKADRDDYEGWAKRADFCAMSGPATHYVTAPLALVYADQDFHGVPLHTLPMNAQLRVGEAAAVDAFLALEGGGYIPAQQAAPSANIIDPVTIAKQFLGTPYAWGGRTLTGIDCSGLVQQALWACGKPCPRDSGDQWRSLGRTLSPDETPEHGDLVFFPGHVGFYIDGGNLLHANATHMRCTVDPLGDVISWAAKDHESPLTGFKRI